MIAGRLDDIDADVLQTLIDNVTSESRTLEFKQDLPKDGKEFLADVTAFANANGGDLVLGIGETDGVASELTGLEGDGDSLILALETQIRTGVEPRIAGLRSHWVRLPPGRGILILRIPVSAAAPHRVILQGHNRFYTRNSRGKHQMDTHDLRHAFLAGEAQPEKLRVLHAQAIDSAAKGRNLPFAIHKFPAAVVSIIPFSFLREASDYEVTPETAVAPVKATDGLHAVQMIEGVLLHSPLNAGSPENSNRNSVRTYALTHRRGRVDVAWTIGRDQVFAGDMSAVAVWPNRFEEGLADAVKSSGIRFRDHGIEGPYLILASVFGIGGGHLILDSHHSSEGTWRNQALLGEILADDLNTVSLDPLKSAFWLAFGVPRPT